MGGARGWVWAGPESGCGKGPGTGRGCGQRPWVRLLRARRWLAQAQGEVEELQLSTRALLAQLAAAGPGSHQLYQHQSQQGAGSTAGGAGARAGVGAASPACGASPSTQLPKLQQAAGGGEEACRRSTSSIPAAPACSSGGGKGGGGGSPAVPAGPLVALPQLASTPKKEAAGQLLLKPRGRSASVVPSLITLGASPNRTPNETRSARGSFAAASIADLGQQQQPPPPPPPPQQPPPPTHQPGAGSSAGFISRGVQRLLSHTANAAALASSAQGGAAPAPAPAPAAAPAPAPAPAAALTASRQASGIRSLSFAGLEGEV